MDDRRIDTLWSHVHALSILGTLGSYTAAAQRLGLSLRQIRYRIARLAIATPGSEEADDPAPT